MPPRKLAAGATDGVRGQEAVSGSEAAPHAAAAASQNVSASSEAAWAVIFRFHGEIARLESAWDAARIALERAHDTSDQQRIVEAEALERTAAAAVKRIYAHIDGMPMPKSMH